VILFAVVQRGAWGGGKRVGYGRYRSLSTEGEKKKKVKGEGGGGEREGIDSSTFVREGEKKRGKKEEGRGKNGLCRTCALSH